MGGGKASHRRATNFSYPGVELIINKAPLPISRHPLDTALRAFHTPFMAAPTSTSPTHDQIALWLLQNPGPRLSSRCAEAFGYTLPWISTLINSDAFRARLSEVQALADAAVAVDIPAKLRGVASLALDALTEQLDTAAKDGGMLHREFVKETADMALHRLGYAPQKQQSAPGLIVNQQNNFLPVAASDLAAARQHFAPATSPATGAIPQFVEVLPSDPPPAL